MNKQEFICKLVSLYDDFTDKNIKPRTEAYDLGLSENLNFDDLFKKVIENYPSFKIAPTVAQILEIKNKKTFNMNRDFFGIEG